MRDDIRDDSQRERSRVEQDESWELRYLAQELGVKHDELGEALKQARLLVSAYEHHAWPC
jgi:uncharacterized protein DUF3606